MRNLITSAATVAARAVLAALVVILAVSTAWDDHPTITTTHVPGGHPAADMLPVTYPVPPGTGEAQQGEPTDDSPGFDCRTHGNGVCGEDNPQGHPAGCYVRTGKRAGTLLTPWDEQMRQELFTGAYRPTRCGRLTIRDKQMARRLDGSVGQLCAGNAHGGVTCWYADQPRPHDADGAPWDPAAGR
jgi:hypothetical protein